MASSELQGFKDAEVLDMLSKQRMTRGREEVFDASQFRLAVGQDVPPKTIEKLQAECGENLAGAIDKFLDKLLDTKLKSSSPLVEAYEDDAKNESQEKDAAADPLDRKAFVVRDRFWNKMKREYVLQKPAKPRADTKKHKKPVILVRRDYQEDMISFTTALVISGSVLRNALRHIFRGAAGFTLTASDSTELTPQFMFWARPELDLLAAHYRRTTDQTALFEIEAALSFIDSEYSEMLSILPTLLPQSISFEYLWAILPSDCLVVGKNRLNFDSIWCVRSHTVEKMEDGTFLTMSAEVLLWDGTKAGRVPQTLRTPIFAGVKLLTDLPYIPLKHHPKRDATIREVRERSGKALEFWKYGFQHQEHHGTGIAEVYDRVEPFPFSGRIIIDPEMMQQMQPANKIMPSANNMSDLRTTSRTCIADLTTDEQKSEILATLLTDAGKSTIEDVEPPPSHPHLIQNIRVVYLNSQTPPNDSSLVPSSDSEPGKIPELDEVQKLLVSGLLYGYSLREGKWGAFAVDRVTPIQWNSTIFTSLVMDPSLKDTIYRLVVAHSRSSSSFDDFVAGKGRGLVGLFFGPPGAGKTLTAEAIAETAQMPLYAVSSGALGHEATQIHERLSVILKLAGHWKAVLLLDEADVFLAQRTVTDIERNAIVSIFLRELEYYQGILLLTTNQVEVIDEAFQSRIHLSLRYPNLDATARFKIWSNFMDIARKSGEIKVGVDEASLRELAELPLNGRQIKNTISIAVKIATTTESRLLTADSLKDTVRLLQNSPFLNEKEAA